MNKAFVILINCLVVLLIVLLVAVSYFMFVACQLYASWYGGLLCLVGLVALTLSFLSFKLLILK